MAKRNKLKSARTFGARYGRTVKHKYAAIHEQQKAKYQCPNCRALKVTRLSLGIWQCGKCGAKFAGKAYTVSQKRTAEKAQEETYELTLDLKKDEEDYLGEEESQMVSSPEEPEQEPLHVEEEVKPEVAQGE